MWFSFFDSMEFKQKNKYYASYRNQAVLGENFMINEKQFHPFIQSAIKWFPLGEWVHF